MEENTTLFWKTFLKKSANDLEPSERYLEVMFGVIMALSFTSAVSVSHQGSASIEHLLWATLSCNVAWGIIDGLTFLIKAIISRSRKRFEYFMIRNAKTKEEGLKLAREQLQVFVSIIIPDEQVHHLYEKIMTLPPPPKNYLFNRVELKSAALIFLINFLCTLPVALPFLLMSDAVYAKLVSDFICLVILFHCGYALAKYAAFRPLLGGFGMVLLAAGFFVLTELLGG